MVHIAKEETWGVLLPPEARVIGSHELLLLTSNKDQSRFLQPQGLDSRPISLRGVGNWNCNSVLIQLQMGSETPSIPTNVPQETSNSDEYFLQHSLVFAERLKDLKNLRVQLYSAAEYFESSYEKHEYKQLVVETLKDYASKALISTVDHLGSVAHKVDSFLDKKVNEMSATRLQFSCLEQRLRTCRGYTDRNGLLQQSLVIKTPRHYKHYTVPVADGKFTRKFDSLGNVCFLNPHEDKHPSKQDGCRLEKFQGAVAKPRPTLRRRGHSESEPPPTELFPRPLSFSFLKVASDKEVGKRTASPFRLPLKRSGSVANRSTSPNSSATKQRCPSEPPRAISTSTNPDRNRGKEIEPYSRKSKHLFKALLSIHRSRKHQQGVPVPLPYRFSSGI